MGKTKIKESLGRMTCQFPKCTSNSDEEQAENVIFFKFPENPHLRKTWLKLLKLKKVPRDARICSKHFPVHMLKKRKVRNSGNVKIKLIEGAFPFSVRHERYLKKNPVSIKPLDPQHDHGYSKQKEILKDTLAKKKKEEIPVEIKQDFNQPPDENLNQSHAEAPEINQDITEEEDPILSIINKFTKNNAPKKRSQDNILIKSLLEKVTALEDQLGEVQKELEEERKITGAVRKVFRADQVRIMANIHTKWSPETMARSLTVQKMCGKKGYEFLRFCGLPYPCQKTIDRHKSSRKNQEKAENMTDINQDSILNDIQLHFDE